MKKCPSCNSSKYTEETIEGKLVRHCKRCGFVNKSNDDKENESANLNIV